MKKLFGTSGVRGVVGKQITPRLAIDIGSALATHMGNLGTVIVGKDPRTSSDMLESCLISGLLSGGCDVKRLGIVPTPALSFAVRSTKATAGIMITASHNPPEYNGIKFWEKNGMAYSPKAEKEIEMIYYLRRFRRVGWEKMGTEEKHDSLSGYISVLAKSVQLTRKYKVVVDCGNGAGSVATPTLLRKLSCEVTSVNYRPDGLFPGRLPEPSPENLAKLCRVVKSTGSNLGIAHDGDADRVVVVDETGRIVPDDKILALVAASQVSGNNNIVVTSVDASNIVDEVVCGRGGRVVRTRVGDVNVAAEIKRTNAVFGGEPCGAWIFPSVNISPDGPLGAAKVLELMNSSGERISKLLEQLPDYHMNREKIPCPTVLKPKFMKIIPKRLKMEFREAIGALKIDGFKLNLEDGWVLIRPSGTEPYIRITAEGRTHERASEIAEKAVTISKQAINYIR